MRNAASPIRNCGCFNILMMIYSLVCVIRPSPSAYASAGFRKKRSGGMRVGGFERRLSRPTTASRLPTAFSMASVNPMLLSRQHAICGTLQRASCTPCRDSRAEGGRRENRKRFCDFTPAISFVSRLPFAAPLTVQREYSDNSLVCA